MQEIFSLTGKTILVTGASSGIGRAVAQQCAAAGATCILTARNQERLQQTLTSLNGEGHSVFVADLSTVEGVQELVSALPKVNGIVCCAGVVETQMLKFTDDSDLQKLFNTNAFSAIRLIREAVQQKRLQKESSIVMISSISGVRCGYLILVALHYVDEVVSTIRCVEEVIEADIELDVGIVDVPVDETTTIAILVKYHLTLIIDVVRLCTAIAHVMEGST